MQIRLLVSMAGPENSWSPGDVIDWPDEEAARLVEAGYAELVRTEAVETAIASDARVEKAVGRRKS